MQSLIFSGKPSHPCRNFILYFFATVLIVSFVPAPKKKAAANKPNIVFILVDDQAWNAWGKPGRYPFLQTPNIDRLADEGIWFDQAFVTTSLCSPSRACFLTGTYAHMNGVYVNSYADPSPDIPFLPSLLQQAGYATAFVGKWHMKPGTAPRKGFDYWLSFEGQGQYTDPALNENGRNFIQRGYITNILTGYAGEWLQKNTDKPFCLFLWHKAVHAPFVPDPADSAAFSDASIPAYENWYDDMSDKPEWLRRGWLYGVHNKNWTESRNKPVPARIDPRPWNPQNPQSMNYLRSMLAVDRSVGMIRKKLEENQMLENTIFIYASDNGFFLGAHQRGDKRLMYEESLRIPLIIRYPRLIKPGSVNHEMVLNIDLAPTLLELAGAAVPEKMQGNSLVSLLGNKKVQWRKSFMYEYFQEAYAPGLVTVTGVRTKKYKYIESLHQQADINELYDLKKDAGEMDNKINHRAYRSVQSDMIKELQRLKILYGFSDPMVYKE
jgi:N-acetylglucosamine-6-sulfatase